MNDTYGIKVSLYCFNNYNNIKLEECTDKFKQQFIENSDWLKFGFHAKDNSTDYSVVDTNQMLNDYNSVISQLERIVGNESITNVIRLEKFIISEENASILRTRENELGFLGADTQNRQNYYLNDKQNSILFNNDYYYDEKNEIFFYNTDYRIENMNLENIELELSQNNTDNELIVFTHEWMFNDENNRIATKNKIVKICTYALKNGYAFSFPKIR